MDGQSGKAGQVALDPDLIGDARPTDMVLDFTPSIYMGILLQRRNYYCLDGKLQLTV